jgi:hypothetical protein
MDDVTRAELVLARSAIRDSGWFYWVLYSVAGVWICVGGILIYACFLVGWSEVLARFGIGHPKEAWSALLVMVVPFIWWRGCRFFGNSVDRARPFDEEKRILDLVEKAESDLDFRLLCYQKAESSTDAYLIRDARRSLISAAAEVKFWRAKLNIKTR